MLKPVLVWKYLELTVSAGTSWLIFDDGLKVSVRGRSGLEALRGFTASAIAALDKGSGCPAISATLGGQEFFFSRSGDETVMHYGGTGRGHQVDATFLTDIHAWLAACLGTEPVRPLADDAGRFGIGKVGESIRITPEEVLEPDFYLDLSANQAVSLRDLFLEGAQLESHMAHVRLPELRVGGGCIAITKGSCNAWTYLLFKNGQSQTHVNFGASSCALAAQRIDSLLRDAHPAQ